MIVGWLVFVLAIIIFSVVGWTGIFHAKRYKIPGDLTGLAVNLYLFAMVSIVALVILLVFLNGVNAPIVLPNFNGAIKGLKL